MVYDAFTFNGEYEMLEIRFNILNKYVDKFIICESEQTFSGNWKPLYWAERGDGFEEFENKVIYHVVGSKDFKNAFERAAFQKDSIRDCLKMVEAKPNDVIIYGDIDEIPNPELLIKLL